MGSKSIAVTAGKPYEVTVAGGSLASAGKVLRRFTSSGRVAVISDDRVMELWGGKLLESLAGAGFAAETFVFPNGEASKNLNTYIDIIEFLAGKRFTRTDILIAFGGGVVGDLAGFAAATYLRGIDFMQIPTTLLAMVDSSVGGKTGADLEAGKNLVGAFHQPVHVLCDPELLSTLPELNWADGASEAVKSGMIDDVQLFELLSRGGWRDQVEEVISSCVAFKSRIVAADEFESGERKLLNFGHTVGHAVEKLSNFTISHGHAVAIGMMAVARAAAAGDLTSRETVLSLERALQNNALPTELPFAVEELVPAMAGDKKRSGNKLTLVLPERVGKCRLLSLSFDEAMDFLRSVR